MDTIEQKIEQLKKLSKKQKTLNEFKQDIADILSNTDKEAQKKIAEWVSKMKYENIEHARNLQLIVPNIIKDNYEHNGKKGEFIQAHHMSTERETIADKADTLDKVWEPEIIVQKNPIEEKIPTEEVAETKKIIKNNEKTPINIEKPVKKTERLTKTNKQWGQKSIKATKTIPKYKIPNTKKGIEYDIKKIQEELNKRKA